MDTLSTSQFVLLELNDDEASTNSMLMDIQPGSRYLTDLSRITTASTSTSTARRYMPAYRDTVVSLAEGERDVVDQHPSMSSKQRLGVANGVKSVATHRTDASTSASLALSRETQSTASQSGQHLSSARKSVANHRAPSSQLAIAPPVISHDARDIIRRIRESRQAIEAGKTSPNKRPSPLSETSSQISDDQAPEDSAFKAPSSRPKSALLHNDTNTYKNAEKSRMLCDLADNGETFLLDTTMSGLLAAPSSARKVRSHGNLPGRPHLRANDTLYDDMTFALSTPLPPSPNPPALPASNAETARKREKAMDDAIRGHVPVRTGHLQSTMMNQTIVDGSIRLKVGNEKPIMSESFFAPIQDTETTIEAEQSEIIAPRPAWAKYLKDRDAVPARSNVLRAASPASRAQRPSPAKHLEKRHEFVPLLPKSLSTTNLDSPSATARNAALPRSPTKLDVVSRLREEAGVARSPLRAYAPAQGTPTDRRRIILAGSPAVRRLSASPATPLAGKTPVARAVRAEVQTGAAVTPPTMTRVAASASARRLTIRADPPSLATTTASRSTRILAERPGTAGTGSTRAIAPPISASAHLARSKSLNMHALASATRQQGLNESPSKLFAKMRAHQPAPFTTVAKTVSPSKTASSLDERIAARKIARLASDPARPMEAAHTLPKSASLASLHSQPRQPPRSMAASTSRLARPSMLPSAASSRQLPNLNSAGTKTSSLSRSTSSVSSLSSSTRSQGDTAASKPSAAEASTSVETPQASGPRQIGPYMGASRSSAQLRTAGGAKKSISTALHAFENLKRQAGPAEIQMRRR